MTSISSDTQKQSFVAYLQPTTTPPYTSTNVNSPFNPPISNVSKFRAISNVHCIVNCDFAKPGFQFDGNTNQLSRSQAIEVGLTNVYFDCNQKDIITYTVSLDTNSTPLTNGEQVQLFFEFIQ